MRTGKLAGHDTYQGLVAFCFGRVGLVAISVFQLVFAFGGTQFMLCERNSNVDALVTDYGHSQLAMCAYLVIIGDTLPVVLHALINSSTGASPPNVPLSPWVEVLTGRRFIILATTFAVILPLSLLRDIGKLSKTSGAAMIALLYIIVAVMVEGPRTMWDEEGRERKPAIIAFVHPEILSVCLCAVALFARAHITHMTFPLSNQAISVISFAFVCHHNSFLIFASLKRPTLDRWKMVTNLSTGISLLLSALLAVSGYLSFGGNTRGNILNNFPADNVIINVARLCFAFNIFTTYPLECFVCREVILAYVYGEAGSAGDVSTTSNKAHRLVTVTLVVTSLLISMITCDLGVVLELTGCMSATALAYILPPLCYLKLASGSIWRWEKVACMACVGVGTFIMVVSTATTVWSAMHHTSTKMCRW